MTLEFLVPQLHPNHHQEGNMYRQQASQVTQAYPSYSYSHTPTTQYLAEYPPPGSGQYQTPSSVDVQQHQPHPAANSWGSGGLPAAGLPSLDWGASQDPFAANAYPGQTPAGPVGGSPYNSEELELYQGFGATPAAVNSVSHALHRPAMRSPYQDWMRSTSYRVNPQTGKTRTKDKYRVVYSDHQRLELEKEFHYSRYITIRRKAELAVSLGLSERQVKIWFQNRRAKERKQNKKRAAAGGDTTGHTPIDPSSVDQKTAIDGDMKTEKGSAVTGEVCTAGSSPSSTPELLELSRPHHPHSHQRSESEVALGATQLPPFGHGACQLQSTHHPAVTASLTLLHDMPQMHLK